MFGDCLERMKEIPDNSVDMVLTDPPYGTTRCKWDTVIDFELMWRELKRITKGNGAICLFGSEPFSSSLRMSNIKMFKYDWIWHKNNKTGHLNAKKMPMKVIENISVFKYKISYYPQNLKEYNKWLADRNEKLGLHGASGMGFTQDPSSTPRGRLVSHDEVETRDKLLQVELQRTSPYLDFLYGGGWG